MKNVCVWFNAEIFGQCSHDKDGMCKNILLQEGKSMGCVVARVAAKK